uniref:hypothetical protein n=1 Tax=Streptomyces sp. CA-136453 TaxID=3240050 RepID=UPI003F496B04
MSVSTASSTFAEMLRETAALLWPAWTEYPHRGGAPHTTFADEIGRTVSVHEEHGQAVVTNVLPDGKQVAGIEHATPDAIARAVRTAAEAFDAVDPARAFLNRVTQAIGGRHTVTWHSGSVEVVWHLPDAGIGSLNIGRAVRGSITRAVASLMFSDLSVAVAVPILTVATAGHGPGEADGAGEAAQPLIKAAPALWLTGLLENDETGVVERTDLTVDDVHVSVTGGHAGHHPARVSINVASWLGTEHILRAVTAAPRA